MLHHPIFTNGIAYLNLWFDSSALPEELIPYAGLLVNVLGKIGTENFSYEELTKEINIHTGGINYSMQGLALNGRDGEFVPKLLVRSKALTDKLPELLGLLKEIVTGSVFEDTRRLKEIVQETRSHAWRWPINRRQYHGHEPAELLFRTCRKICRATFRHCLLSLPV